MNYGTVPLVYLASIHQRGLSCNLLNYMNFLMGREGLEPSTNGLRVHCSTIELTARGSGVNDGTRTHDDRNHNPGLYQLSYAHHRRCAFQRMSPRASAGVWRARQDSNLQPSA